MNIPSLVSKDDQEGLSTRFRVVIPGMNELVFRSCEGMESEMEVTSISEGGRMGAPRTARGHQRVNRMSFSHGSAAKGAGGRSVFDWYMEVCDASKALSKKTLSVVVTDAEGRDLAEWRIVNAWPCRWVAPVIGTDHSRLTVEYISFAHEGIERKK